MRHSTPTAYILPIHRTFCLKNPKFRKNFFFQSKKKQSSSKKIKFLSLCTLSENKSVLSVFMKISSADFGEH